MQKEKKQTLEIFCLSYLTQQPGEMTCSHVF